jgi:hypothetical protein
MCNRPGNVVNAFAACGLCPINKHAIKEDQMGNSRTDQIKKNEINTCPTQIFFKLSIQVNWAKKTTS